IVLDAQQAQIQVTRANYTIDGTGPRTSIISGADAAKGIAFTFPRNQGFVQMNDLAIVHMKNAGDGGALTVAGSWVLMTRVALTDNQAANGGGIAVSGGGYAGLLDGLVARNSATANGGGMDVKGGGSDVVLSNVTVTGNAAN